MSRPPAGRERDAYICYAHDHLARTYASLGRELGITTSRVYALYWLAKLRAASV